MLKRGRARRAERKTSATDDHRSRLFEDNVPEKVKDRAQCLDRGGSVLDGAEVSHSIVDRNAKITKSV